MIYEIWSFNRWFNLFLYSDYCCLWDDRFGGSMYNDFGFNWVFFFWNWVYNIFVNIDINLIMLNFWLIDNVIFVNIDRNFFCLVDIFIFVNIDRILIVLNFCLIDFFIFVNIDRIFVVLIFWLIEFFVFINIERLLVIVVNYGMVFYYFNLVIRLLENGGFIFLRELIVFCIYYFYKI